MEQKPVVIYLSPYDILRPRTNQVSDVRFSEGFSQNGCEVHLVAPFVLREDNINEEDVSKIYGLESDIKIHYLPTAFKKDVSGKISSFVVAFLAALQVRKILRNYSSDRKIYIISRSAYLLKTLLFIRKYASAKFKKTKLIFWAHDFKNKPSFTDVYKECDALLATNSSIINDLCKVTGKEQSKTFVTLNPITKLQAESKLTKTEAREILNLSQTELFLIYTGKVAIDYNEELKYLLKAVKLIPEMKLLCTGGKPEALAYWKNYCDEQNIQNVIFTGYISDYSKIKYYQYAADILISYYTKQGHDVSYNLPNKICEYMLTGNIIITPDYPATRDLLNNNNCCFTVPENEKELAKSINYILNNEEEMQKKAVQAREDVHDLTFKKQTALVMNFLQKI